MADAYLIVGPGAIGTYIGGHLALAGRRVVFWARAGSGARLRTRGLIIRSATGPPRRVPPDALGVVTSAEEALRAGPYRAAFLTVKTYHLADVLPALRRAANAWPVLVDLLNGVGSTERLRSVLGPDAVLPGTVTTAVERRGPGDITVARPRGLGLTRHPATEALAATLEGAGLTVRLYPDGRALKWTKLLTNLLGNATSAILDWPPSRIYAHPGLFALERAQLREALAVMDALGLEVVALPGTPSRALAWGARHVPSWLLRPILRYKVGRGRGAKMPSLHQDVHQGKRQTEIDALHGAVARTARDLGLPAPTNALLAGLVRGLSQGDISPETFRHNPAALLTRWRAALEPPPSRAASNRIRR